MKLTYPPPTYLANKPLIAYMPVHHVARPAIGCSNKPISGLKLSHKLRPTLLFNFSGALYKPATASQPGSIQTIRVLKPNVDGFQSGRPIRVPQDQLLLKGSAAAKHLPVKDNYSGIADV